jgi:hypothetical protein
MPQNMFVVPHHLPRDRIITILHAFLFQEVMRNLKEDSTSVHCHWKKNLGTFCFTAMGKPVRALVELPDDRLEVKFTIEANQEMGVHLETVERVVSDQAKHLFANSERFFATYSHQTA